jgi:hypothetical protein
MTRGGLAKDQDSGCGSRAGHGVAVLGERLNSGEGRARTDSVRLANIRAILHPKGSEERRLVEAMLLAVPR